MGRVSNKSRVQGYYRRGSYQTDRLKLLADHPPCVHHGPLCTGTATEADHQPPLALHEHVPGSGCCILVPSCAPCNRSQGGQVAAGNPLRARAVPIVEPPAIPLEAFDVPWLAELLDVPNNATWPRLMTAPHPLAVGSYGELVEAYSEGYRGVPFRWWQRLASRRLLEHDADGRLLWKVAILTLARQLGKSYWLGDLCSWRLHAAELFGVPQMVLSTAKDVAVSKEMQRAHRLLAKRDRDRYVVREVNGQEEIELLGDGSRWVLRAKEAVYGLTATFATVDEAWKVLASIVDDGIEPTTVEAKDSQILLASTAHRRATALMVGRRARALQHLDDGRGPLLLEWSAPPDAELEDRAGWRMASPEWSPYREELIEQRLEGALSGESDDPDEPDPIISLRTQWLNQWPAKRLALTKGEPLVELDVLERCDGEVLDNIERLYVAVEDHSGFGCAVAAVAVQPDGRYGLDGWLTETWSDAQRDIRRLTASHELVKLQAGASLTVRLPRGAQAVTSSATRATLAAMRQLFNAGEVVYDSVDLFEQLDSVRVAEAIGGLAIVPGPRSDLLRAASWALAAAARPRRTPSVR